MAASWAKVNIVYRRLGIKLYKTQTAKHLVTDKQTRKCFSILVSVSCLRLNVLLSTYTRRSPDFATYIDMFTVDIHAK